MIEKTYKFSHLCDDPFLIDWRINQIMEVTRNLLAPVIFEKNSQILIRKTKRTQLKSIIYGNLPKEHIYQLSQFLDKIHSLNLVHGDINKKNLFLDKDNNIILIDWEPCLKQIINNRYSLMGTHPWIDIDDKKNKNITIRTDLLCFYKVISNFELSFFNSKLWLNLLENSLLNKQPFSYLTDQYFLKELT